MQNEHADKLSASKFTNVGVGAIAASAIELHAYEELLDLSTDLADAAVRKFQNEMPGRLSDAIAEWFKDSTNVNPADVGELLMQCCFYDTVDSIIEQLGGELRGVEHDKCIFTPKDNRHTYNGSCDCGVNSVGDASKGLSGTIYDPEEIGDEMEEWIAHDPFSRLEIVIVGDDVNATVHVMCSPYIANRKLLQGKAEYNLGEPEEYGDLCYTLPPWFFTDKKLLAGTGLVTEYPALRGRHMEYIDYLASVAKATQKEYIDYLTSVARATKKSE